MSLSFPSIVNCISNFSPQFKYNVDPKYIPLVVSTAPFFVAPALLSSLASSLFSHLTATRWQEIITTLVHLTASGGMAAVSVVEIGNIVKDLKGLICLSCVLSDSPLSLILRFLSLEYPPVCFS